MESWSVGFDGDKDVERHAGVADSEAGTRPDVRIRAASDYI